MMALGDTLVLVLSFAVLMLLVGKFAWGPVSDIMAKRQEKIDTDLDYAENAREEAETLAKQRQEALQHSQQDAVQIVATAKANGEKQRQTMLDQAQSEVTKLKQNAQASIESDRQTAMEQAKNDVAELSLAIASKIMAKELSAADQQSLIDDYIKGLGETHGTN